MAGRNGSPGPQRREEITLRMPLELLVALHGYKKWGQSGGTLVSLNTTIVKLIETHPDFLRFLTEKGYTVGTQARP